MWSGLPPALVWVLVPRVVGAIYFMVFAGLAVQVRGLIGSRGVGPVRDQLAAARTHFPGPARFFRWPTLFWVSTSDRAVVLAPIVGMAASVAVMAGAPGATAALAICYAMLLTLDVVGLSYPWDCLAFEAGFLALLLPAAPALPSPLLAFAWRFFLVRVMWGFARVKFTGTQRGDSIYIKGFLGFMPQMTPIGHRLYRLPEPVLRAMYGFMWFAEVVCPGLTFFSGLPRLIGAAGLVALMGGIFLTGNWGWFNIGYALLCVAFLDTHASVLDVSWSNVVTSPRDLVVAAHLVLALFYFATTNTWSNLVLPRLPLDQGGPWWSPLRVFLMVVRAVAPFRVTAGYGVFPPNSRAPLRPIPIFEGSNDGVNWEAYEYRFFTSHVRTAPRFFAPHHPRLDHFCVYAGYGVTGNDFVQLAADANHVYGFTPFARHSWLERAAERLLDGEKSVLALFGRSPFETPPKLVRVVMRAFEPTDSASDVARGVYWREHDLGVFLPPRASDPGLWNHWQPAPEMFHPAQLSWRRASPALRTMIAAHAAGAEPNAAVRVASDFDEADVHRFWEDFVPLVAKGRGDVARAEATARELAARYGQGDRARFERIAARFAYLLQRHLEADHLAGGGPMKAMFGYLPLHLLAYEIVLDGRAAYLAALAAPPATARARMAEQTDASAFHFLLVVHNDQLHLTARGLRYYYAIRGRALTLKLPGLAQYRPFLRAHVRRAEERIPIATCHPSGTWTIEGTRVPAAEDV